MTTKVIRRLGTRLDHIFKWVDIAAPYSDIWDLCCDHGRLGLHLHKKQAHADVYLIDKVTNIIDQLRADYGYLNDGRLHIKTADVKCLDIVVKNHTLVIIAGVGGQNIISMLNSILTRIRGTGDVDFMLSPNAHVFELRSFLIAHSFSLIEEAFISENHFSHEHLWLRYTMPAAHHEEQNNLKPVPIIGDAIWHEMTDTKISYIHKLIDHYQRMRDNQGSKLYQDALKAYQGLL